MNTSGFYNNKGEYAPNSIYAPTYTLLAENKNSYNYPVNGWTWYNSIEEAQLAEGFDESLINDILAPYKQV